MEEKVTLKLTVQLTQRERDLLIKQLRLEGFLTSKSTKKEILSELSDYASDCLGVEASDIEAGRGIETRRG